MGIHIVVRDIEGNRHPDWDWIRYGGDREFWWELFSHELEYVHDPDYGDTLGFRPKDIEEVRGAIPQLYEPNVERLNRLLDLLAEDDRWFLDDGW